LMNVLNAAKSDTALQLDLRELMGALRPYIDESSGIGTHSHKKKARFWRRLIHAFPQVIDMLCYPNELSQDQLLKGLDR